MGLFSFLKEGKSLYIPGSTAYFRYPKSFELYKKIFNRLSIPFTILENNLSSGLKSRELGYEQEARKIARKNFQTLKQHNIKEIFTTSPECYKAFTIDYPEILPDWDIEVKNIWKILLSKLNKKHRLIKFKADETITFHDSCYLGRYSSIYDTPRTILESIGFEIKEMENSKNDSFCCGSCGALTITNLKLANKIARERILQAKRIKVKKMIVIGFENYDILTKNSKESGIKVMELSEVLADALRLKVQFEEEEFLENEEDILKESESELKTENNNDFLEEINH